MCTWVHEWGQGRGSSKEFLLLVLPGCSGYSTPLMQFLMFRGQVLRRTKKFKSGENARCNQHKLIDNKYSAVWYHSLGQFSGKSQGTTNCLPAFRPPQLHQHAWISTHPIQQVWAGLWWSMRNPGERRSDLRSLGQHILLFLCLCPMFPLCHSHPALLVTSLVLLLPLNHSCFLSMPESPLSVPFCAFWFCSPVVVVGPLLACFSSPLGWVSCFPGLLSHSLVSWFPVLCTLESDDLCLWSFGPGVLSCPMPHHSLVLSPRPMARVHT